MKPVDRVDAPPDLTDRVFKAGIELMFIVGGAVLWLVCSLLIVTLPAASVALYSLLTAHVVDADRRFVKPFFEHFWAGFARATVPGLILVIVALLSGFDAWYYAVSRGGAVGWGLALVQAVLSGVLAVWASFFFAQTARSLRRHEAGRGEVPSVLDGLRLIAAHPLWSLAALGVIIGVPALVVWTGLWQFAPFVVGVIAYSVVRILARAGVWPAPAGASRSGRNR